MPINEFNFIGGNMKRIEYKNEIKNRGLKQKWVCEQIGVSNAALSMFLNDKLDLGLNKERKLKELLGIRKE